MAAPNLRRTWRRVAGAVGPSVTNLIIVVTGLVYIAQMLPGIGDTVTGALLYAPYYSVVEVEPWRLVTVALVHSTSSLFHIIFNMLALWMFGQQLESMLGRGRFLALYVISALGGSVAVLYVPFLANGSVVGASGAIFGLLGAFFVLVRRLGGNTTGLLIVIGLNLAVGFFIGTVSWQSHVGGLLAGALVAAIFARTRHRSQRGLQVTLVSVVGAVLLVLGVLPAFLGL